MRRLQQESEREFYIHLHTRINEKLYQRHEYKFLLHADALHSI